MVQNIEYGFNDDARTGDSSRIKAPTDYAKAQGMDEELGWMLRSTCYGISTHEPTSYIIYIDDAGRSKSNLPNYYYGVAPCLYLKL